MRNDSLASQFFTSLQSSIIKIKDVEVFSSLRTSPWTCFHVIFAFAFYSGYCGRYALFPEDAEAPRQTSIYIGAVLFLLLGIYFQHEQKPQLLRRLAFFGESDSKIFQEVCRLFPFIPRDKICRQVPFQSIFTDIVTCRPQHDAVIKHLVLPGGGGKGVMYSGVVQSLFETGFIRTVESVYGASCGACVSMVLAIGITGDHYREWAQQDISIFMGDRVDWYNPILCSGLPMLEEVRRVAHECLARFFESAPGPLPPRLEALRSRLELDYKITFRDLAELRDYAPWKFKNLVVTATNINKDVVKNQEFSFSATPDVEIVHAVFASMLIPGVFLHTTIPGFDGGFVDAMITNNIPSNLVPKGAERNTLVFHWVDSDTKEGYSLWDPTVRPFGSRKIDRVMVSFLKRAGKLALPQTHNLYQSFARETDDVQKRFLDRVIPLDARGVTCANFSRAAAYFHIMRNRAYFAIMDYHLGAGHIESSIELEYRRFAALVLDHAMWNDTSAKHGAIKPLIQFADGYKLDGCIRAPTGQAFIKAFKEQVLEYKEEAWRSKAKTAHLKAVTQALQDSRCHHQIRHELTGIV